MTWWQVTPSIMILSGIRTRLLDDLVASCSLSIGPSEHQASRAISEKCFVSDEHGMSASCLLYTKDVCVIH